MVQANRFRSLLPSLKANDSAAYRECEELFDSICRIRLSSVPPEFRLATWEARAEARAGERGVKAWRRMITEWAGAKYGHTQLADYANREYFELVRDYYIPRWRAFLKECRD